MRTARVSFVRSSTWVRHLLCAALLGACGSVEVPLLDGGAIDPHTPDGHVAPPAIDAVIVPPPDAAIEPPPDAAIEPPPDAAIEPPPDAAPPATGNIVFVTSTHHDGNLGGLAGADAICNARAAAAGLPGTYRAWLSTTTVSAISRLGAANGWRRPDGKLVARSVADLAADHVFYPPRQDELGHDVGIQVVRTATAQGGSFAGSDTCGEYNVATDGTSVASGMASGVGWLFSAGFGTSCADLTSLYCFGVDDTHVAIAPTATGRLAFATQAAWSPDGGLAGADALCQAEAGAAALPGTFRALLATPTASALSRFDLGGAPWVRPDGVALAPTAAALASAAYLDAPPAVTADARHGFGNDGAWTGAANLSAPGDVASTCNGWSTNSAAATGTLGQLGNSQVHYLVDAFPGTPCNNTMHLICLAR